MLDSALEEGYRLCVFDLPNVSILIMLDSALEANNLSLSPEKETRFNPNYAG